MKLVLTTAVLGLVAIVFASVAMARPAATPVTVNVTGTEFSFKAVKKTVDNIGELYKLESPVKPADLYTNKFVEPLK